MSNVTDGPWLRCCMVVYHDVSPPPSVRRPDSLGGACTVQGGMIHPRMIMTVWVHLASAESAERDVGRRWGWEMGSECGGRSRMGAYRASAGSEQSSAGPRPMYAENDNGDCWT